jgi:ABC-type uncharacterized transport system ATPase subunit
MVSILGGPMTDEKKARIGYMPEERGLNQDVPLERCLLYPASLKDVPGYEGFIPDFKDSVGGKRKVIAHQSILCHRKCWKGVSLMNRKAGYIAL